jgi:hypothetical protein
MTLPKLDPTAVAARRQEDELLRLLASVQAVRARERERIAELAASVGAGTVWRAMLRHGLLPLLGTRLIEATGGLLGAEFQDRVRAGVNRTRARGFALEAMTRHVVERLSDDGIRTLVLKGAYLGERLHGDSGMRQTSDIDLLVAPKDLNRATHALRSVGYHRSDGGQGLPLVHTVSSAEEGWKPDIELHWRIHWAETRFSRRLLERSVPDEQLGRLPALDDDLAMLLCFYARDSLRGLKPIADISAWWDRYGELAPGGLLDDVFDAHPKLRPGFVAATHFAHELGGVPIDRLLSAPPRPSRAVRLAMDLADWRAAATEAQEPADRALIELLLNPSHGHMDWLRRNVVQTETHHARRRGFGRAAALETSAKRGAQAAIAAARFGPPFMGALRRGIASSASAN